MNSSSEESSSSSANYPPTMTVYVLVRTSDREDVPVPHYECEGESEVIGVYASWKLAKTAKRVATADMQQGSNEDDYHDGTTFISTFSIFEKDVEHSVDGAPDSDEDDEGDY
jgi:hypothetical protein